MCVEVTPEDSPEIFHVQEQAQATGEEEVDDDDDSDNDGDDRFTRVLYTQQHVQVRDDVFSSVALEQNGFRGKVIQNDSDKKDFSVHDIAEQVKTMQAAESSSGLIVDEGERACYFTTETTMIQLDTGYNGLTYVDRATARANVARAKEHGLIVQSRNCNGSTAGIGQSSHSILGKHVLPYKLTRDDGSLYCLGFTNVTETEHGPNLAGLPRQIEAYLTNRLKPGLPHIIEGHEGSTIVDYTGQHQTYAAIFDLTEADYAILREVQKKNNSGSWCRPVFDRKIEIHADQVQPLRPFDPTTISEYQRRVDTKRLTESATSALALVYHEEEAFSNGSLLDVGGQRPIDNTWNVSTDQIKRTGDDGRYAVYRVQEYGIDNLPDPPKWLRDRVRLRRCVDVLRQERAAPDLHNDWLRTKGEINHTITGGKSAYVSIDYYFHVPTKVEGREAPSWMSSGGREEFEKGGKVDRSRGRLSLDFCPFSSRKASSIARLEKGPFNHPCITVPVRVECSSNLQNSTRCACTRARTYWTCLQLCGILRE
eukprot:GSA25T00012178001.1